MRLIRRGRVSTGIILAMVLGWAYLDWGGRLGLAVLRIVIGSSDYDCASLPVLHIWSYGDVCGSRRIGTMFVILTLLAAAAYVVLLRWMLSPIREMTGAIARLGPTNLGERLHLPGGRRNEMSALSTALDALMDRVAEGYEGQRRFAANASHELRTPLAVQRTLIEVGMAGEPTTDQLDLLTRQLLSTNERNEALIEGLLVLAETDRGLISRIPLRLDTIAAGAVAMYQPSADAADIAISLTLRQVHVEGEEVLLERLIANLLQNAIKYNDPGGTVSVSLGKSPAISVCNTGPIVPAEAVGVIFEPFRRMAGDRLSQGGGSGLGLTIARSITQAHRGTIRAVANVDGGLTVEVELPTPGQT